jgi:hypothetical protein
MDDEAWVWQLVDGEGLVAELVVTDDDFPWLSAEVRATERFERIRPLFEDELRWADRPDEDLAGWEAAYARIRQAVRLLAPDGRPVPEFLLHIDGRDAWWRWSDEPFPEAKAAP